MSVAVIQGAGGSLGSHFARALLLRSKLQVVATSRDPSAARRTILEGLSKEEADKVDESRLKVFEVDAREEETVRKAAEEVRKEFGKKSLRFLLNASGVVRFLSPIFGLFRSRSPLQLRRVLMMIPAQLHADKSITEVDPAKLLESFQVRLPSPPSLFRALSVSLDHSDPLYSQLNTFGPLLTFKHFYPLLPQKNDVKKSSASSSTSEEDPAQGLIAPGLGVLASLTARIGSIGDNSKGGCVFLFERPSEISFSASAPLSSQTDPAQHAFCRWYAYRASKAASNQVIATLQRELSLRSTPSIAIGMPVSFCSSLVSSPLTTFVFNCSSPPRNNSRNEPLQCVFPPFPLPVPFTNSSRPISLPL